MLFIFIVRTSPATCCPKNPKKNITSSHSIIYARDRKFERTTLFFDSDEVLC